MQTGDNTASFAPPEGFVGRDEACRILGVADQTLYEWERKGRIAGGRLISVPGKPGRQKFYPVGELRRLVEELGKPFPPPGFVGRHEAMRMFGVSLKTWERWEREGQITCGKRVDGNGIKLYPLEELRRMLEEFGRLAPPYPDPDRPHVYRVPLTGHDIRRREAVIDAESLPLVQGKRWCMGKTGMHKGMVIHANRDEPTPLRRIILGITEADLNVSHVNGDPLDCRRENLVVLTVAQRTWGTRKRVGHKGRPCTSRFKGVSWSIDSAKWRVQIHKDGKTRWLGSFADEIAAAQAYDEAARELFGEHARLNFPDGVDARLQREGLLQDEGQRRSAAAA